VIQPSGSLVGESRCDGHWDLLIGVGAIKIVSEGLGAGDVLLRGR
jgi:hypothetical protein